MLEKGGCSRRGGRGRAATRALRKGGGAVPRGQPADARGGGAAAERRGAGGGAHPRRVPPRHAATTQEAAHYLEQAGEFLEAGDLYRKLEDFERGGPGYERAGDRAQAAEMFRLGGRPGARGGQLREDRALRRGGGVLDGVRRRATLCGVTDPGGRACSRRARSIAPKDSTTRRSRCSSRSEPAARTSRRPRRCSARSSRVAGSSVSRSMKLKQAIGDGPVDRGSLRLHYTLASVHEANGELREAVDVYEKILACRLPLRGRRGAARGRARASRVARTAGRRRAPPRSSRRSCRRPRARSRAATRSSASSAAAAWASSTRPRTRCSTAPSPSRCCPTRSRRTRRRSRTSCARPRAPRSSTTRTS